MSRKTTPPSNWREARRLRAWELHEQGWKQKGIAQASQVDPSPVFRPRWLFALVFYAEINK